MRWCPTPYICQVWCSHCCTHWGSLWNTTIRECGKFWIVYSAQEHMWVGTIWRYRATRMGIIIYGVGVVICISGGLEILLGYPVTSTGPLSLTPLEVKTFWKKKFESETPVTRGPNWPVQTLCCRTYCPPSSGCFHFGVTVILISFCRFINSLSHPFLLTSTPTPYQLPNHPSHS